MSNAEVVSAPVVFKTHLVDYKRGRGGFMCEGLLHKLL